MILYTSHSLSVDPKILHSRKVLFDLKVLIPPNTKSGLVYCIRCLFSVAYGSNNFESYLAYQISHKFHQLRLTARLLSSRSLKDDKVYIVAFLEGIQCKLLVRCILLGAFILNCKHVLILFGGRNLIYLFSLEWKHFSKDLKNIVPLYVDTKCLKMEWKHDV